ncbi:MAG: TIGR04282 family arsenosugar biosynthesis glycosyltransferase [Betaproteobacteria bacterium]|nr:TIGR04282 family arsenosugar biosynthesis glycosyltransferase [Betaproteobacteria bacterium]
MDTLSRKADPRIALAVFSNAPIPGAVKTRLTPSLGPEAAAALQRALTRKTLATAVAAAIGPVSLWCAPDQSHSFFSDCHREFGVSLHQQQGAELGVRMLNTFRELLADHDGVVLIGTDCPIFRPEHLRDAATTLVDGADAVICPAEDGGYVLVGLTVAEFGLFSGMPWGTDRVMDETRARLRELGWHWRELETLWDVDRPEDYERLRSTGIVSEFTLDGKHLLWTATACRSPR